MSTHPPDSLPFQLQTGNSRIRSPNADGVALLGKARPRAKGTAGAKIGQDLVHAALSSQGKSQCRVDRMKSGNSRTIWVQILALSTSSVTWDKILNCSVLQLPYLFSEGHNGTCFDPGRIN